MNGLCLIGRSFSFASSGGTAPLPPPPLRRGRHPVQFGRSSVAPRPPAEWHGRKKRPTINLKGLPYPTPCRQS